MARPKVFCIGFQKTGTTSLYAALTELGYKTASVVGRGLTAEQLAARGAALCIDAAKSVDAVQDMPWPIFFRELDAAYPGSKFVLTIRDPDAWFRSIETHFGDKPDEMQAFIYGRDWPSPVGARARYISVLTEHENAVRDYFKDRPDDLLVMDLAAGAGWAALCDFLGASAPATPFPVKNRSRDRRTLRYRIRRRLNMLVGRYLAPEKI